MKAFLRTAKIILSIVFGVLTAISIVMLIICIASKNSTAVLGSVIFVVIMLAFFLLFTIMAVAAGKTNAANITQGIVLQTIPQVKPDCKFSGQLISAEGVSIPIKTHYDVTLFGDVITISNQNISVTINKSQIVCVGDYGERERITVNKNTIGRGIAGGVLFGTAGAVVGGLSGAGGKQVEKQHFYTFINFKSSTNEDCRLDFETFPDFNITGTTKFAKAVNPVQPVTTKL
ncbi:MAG: hypothetical protein RRY14_07695 [Hydrogenoanaerobacterium sp.]